MPGAEHTKIIRRGLCPPGSPSLMGRHTYKQTPFSVINTIMRFSTGTVRATWGEAGGSGKAVQERLHLSPEG